MSDWTPEQIATRNEVRTRLVATMLRARAKYGDRITDDALRLAIWEYQSMRCRERMEKERKCQQA